LCTFWVNAQAEQVLFNNLKCNFLNAVEQFLKGTYLVCIWVSILQITRPAIEPDNHDSTFFNASKKIRWTQKNCMLSNQNCNSAEFANAVLEQF
jgi:hypothetical protein